MTNRHRSADSDPVELRAQAVILEHSASVLSATAETFTRSRPHLNDSALEDSTRRTFTVYGAATAGLGDAVGELGEFVRLIADRADPAGVTGSEDAEATHPRRDPTPPSVPSTALSELHELATVMSEAVTPISRQRVNLLSAAAALVTQLPAEQLPRFVYLSSSLATRMLQLTEGLTASGRALLDYSAALERQAEASDDKPETDQGGPRTLDGGAHPHTPLPGEAVRDQLVGAPSRDLDGTTSVDHEVDFLRARNLELLDDQVLRWLPSQAEHSDDVAAAVRAHVSRPEHTGAHHPGTINVLDTVVPVELPSDR